jgi:hypothetical protein
LFCRISNGLEPVAAIFHQHVTDEGGNVSQASRGCCQQQKG